MGIGNNINGGLKSYLKRLVVFCSLLSLLLFFASEARANAAADKLAYAQKRYEDLLKSEKRKSYKSLWLEVIKQFEAVVQSYPSSDEAAKALFTEGVIYREMFNYSITLGELYKSEKTFKRFLKKYPKHPLCADARKNIDEIKVQKEKNNLIRVSTVKPNPDDFPGRDKVLAKEKEEKPKKKVNKYLAKKEKAPPPEKTDKTEVAKVDTAPPKVEEPVAIKTAKYEAPPKVEEPPRVDVAKVALPTAEEEDSTAEYTPTMDSGTGGSLTPEDDPSLPTGWESTENVKLVTTEPTGEDDEAAVDENPSIKAETAGKATHENRPTMSTADLPSPPRTQPQPQLQPIAEVMTIRFFSDTDHTRIVVDTDSGITYKGASLPEDSDVGIGPRIYIDLFDTRLSPGLDSPISIGDGLVERIRWSQNREKIVRVVLDLDDAAEYNVFSLKNPNRVVIDVLRN